MGRLGISHVQCTCYCCCCTSLYVQLGVCPLLSNTTHALCAAETGALDSWRMYVLAGVMPPLLRAAGGGLCS